MMSCQMIRRLFENELQDTPMTRLGLQGVVYDFMGPEQDDGHYERYLES